MNTTINALVAALIIFLSNIVTLFSNDATLTFGEITQAAWVAIAGAALISFFKDYNTINARRIISKTTGSKDGGIQMLAKSGSAGTWGGIFITRDKDGKPKFDDPNAVPQEVLDVLTEDDKKHLESLKLEVI